MRIGLRFVDEVGLVTTYLDITAGYGFTYYYKVTSVASGLESVCSIVEETNEVDVTVVVLNGSVGDSFTLELPTIGITIPLEGTLLIVGLVGVTVVALVVIMRRKS